MREYIEKQIHKNREMNLLFTHAQEVAEIDSDFLNGLIHHKEKGVPLPVDLIEFTVDQTLSAVYRVNQYIDVSGEDRAALRHIYESTYNSLNTADIRSVLKDHHRNLGLWLTRLYPSDFVDALSDKKEIGSVVNKEYTAEFQCNILDLKAHELKEPIIDLGCGPNSNLAKILRASFHEVYCLDRELKINDEMNYRLSWFEYTFRKDTWGTVISNMSFSNHFLFTLHNRKELIEKYSIKYFEILESLIVHGSFIYAPGIPYIEKRVDPSRYRILTSRVAGDLLTTRVQKISF